MNASINFEIRTDKFNNKGECSVKLRVTYNRKNAWLFIGFSVTPNQWNKEKQEVRKTHPRHKIFNDHLERMRAKAQKVILQLKESDKLEAKAVTSILKGHDSSDFFTFADTHIEMLLNKNQIRESKNAKVVVNKIRRFFGKNTLPFKSIDIIFLDEFSSFLKNECKNHNNTIRKNFLYLGRIIKKATKEGLIKNNPLNEFELPQNQASKKDALSYEQIERIIALDLEKDSLIWHTRNYFMFSFYNAGIRFGDLCKLKKENIIEGRLKYLMNKTSENKVPKWKNIKLSEQALKILDEYSINDKNSDDYIFPILNTVKNINDPIIFDKEKQSKTTLANKYLKKIAKLADIDQTLSTHIARHSFANYALKKNMPLYAISKALAHSNLSTTQSYLKAFDEELLDQEMDKLF